MFCFLVYIFVGWILTLWKKVEGYLPMRSRTGFHGSETFAQIALYSRRMELFGKERDIGYTRDEIPPFPNITLEILYSYVIFPES